MSDETPDWAERDLGQLVETLRTHIEDVRGQRRTTIALGAATLERLLDEIEKLRAEQGAAP